MKFSGPSTFEKSSWKKEKEFVEFFELKEIRLCKKNIPEAWNKVSQREEQLIKKADSSLIIFTIYKASWKCNS